MPWCTDCDRYLSPSTVREDGSCPTCGRAVDPGEVPAKVQTTEEALPPVPWSLKVLAVAVAVYLGWRLVQGIDWLLG